MKKADTHRQAAFVITNQLFCFLIDKCLDPWDDRNCKKYDNRLKFTLSLLCTLSAKKNNRLEWSHILPIDWFTHFRQKRFFRRNMVHCMVPTIWLNAQSQIKRWEMARRVNTAIVLLLPCFSSTFYIPAFCPC